VGSTWNDGFRLIVTREPGIWHLGHCVAASHQLACGDAQWRSAGCAPRQACWPHASLCFAGHCAPHRLPTPFSPIANPLSPQTPVPGQAPMDVAKLPSAELITINNVNSQKNAQFYVVGGLGR
jgi:hypothetical protein